MAQIEQARLERFVGQAVGDMAAPISGLLLHLGDRLGLYKAMAGAGPMTSQALADRTGTAPRYVREWLSNQAAGGEPVAPPVRGRLARPATGDVAQFSHRRLHPSHGRRRHAGRAVEHRRDGAGQGGRKRPLSALGPAGIPAPAA